LKETKLQKRVCSVKRYEEDIKSDKIIYVYIGINK
jgi:hypothetical protein